MRPLLAILRPAVKLAPERSPKSSPLRPQDSGAWLDGLVTAAIAVREAGDLTAFPYVRVAASLVVQVLQIIQSVQQNQEDFEELAQSLVQTIVVIRDTLRSCHEEHALSPAFATRCQDLIEWVPHWLDAYWIGDNLFCYQFTSADDIPPERLRTSQPVMDAVSQDLLHTRNHSTIPD
ncbi:hypothetical protein H0H92_003334 [Tricholoma furcatifolium]|nr:hypothetical protein H0H92_003334 [Tricholoma furcatifolium]